MADVPSVEQIHAYLVARGWRMGESGRAAYLMVALGHTVRMLHEPTEYDLDKAVFDISLAERRHPADVRKDILAGVEPFEQNVDDDWTPLWSRIDQVATDRPDVKPDMEPERFARILSREKRPSALDVAQVADAFGVTVSWLLTGDDHGMCEGTIAALQEDLRLGFEYSRRQDEEIADLKRQLLDTRGHDDGCEGGHAGTTDCADITARRGEVAARLRYLEAVLDVFRDADSFQSLMWYRTDDGIRFAVMCSDTFAWGSADVERIEPEDVPLLRQCLTDLRAADPQLGECDLPELFAARKRGMRPMRLFLYPKHHREDPGWPAVRELFLAAGPERDPATEG